MAQLHRVCFFISPQWGPNIRMPPFLFDEQCVFTQAIPRIGIESGDIIVKVRGELCCRGTCSKKFK